jgi:hypothetical protein
MADPISTPGASENPPNEMERFQDFCRLYINRRVRVHFKDIDDLVDEGLDNSNLRHVARVACTHQDKDPITLTTARLLAFSVVLGDSVADSEAIYGIPISTLQETVEFQPQILLKFVETAKDALTHNRQPVQGRISFRLTDTNFTESEARAKARQIKNIFAVPKVNYKKGRTKISYRDRAKGYEFILAVQSELEARELITKTLQINGHTPDWHLLTNSESGRNFDLKVQKTILGHLTDMPKRRPVATCVFRRAELKIHGLKKDIVLVDTSGRAVGAYEYYIYT